MLFEFLEDKHFFSEEVGWSPLTLNPPFALDKKKKINVRGLLTCVTVMKIGLRKLASSNIFPSVICSLHVCCIILLFLNIVKKWSVRIFHMFLTM